MPRLRTTLLIFAILAALVKFPNTALALTFANTGAISIPSSGSAAPYPSTVVVSGVAAAINDVNLTLRGLSHAFPADLDILLVGPGGQTTLLMSDGGGGTDVTALNITFDDAASSGVPNPLTAGTFRPTNFLGNDAFPTPAPSGLYGTQLSIVTDTIANGTWSLFVVDDNLFAAGSIANGWSLEINGAGAVGLAAVPEAPVILYMGLGLFIGGAWLRRYFRKR